MQGSRNSPDHPARAIAPAPGNAPPAARRRSERRRSDRRARPTAPWKDLFSPLRRARGRRASDRKGYVDRYSKQDVALLFAIFLLNIADAFMTMLWLHRGGGEANPVMAFFLDIGPFAFLAQKCLVVGFWLILLLVHKNFRFAKIGLYASLAVYALLLVLHFTIVALGIEPPPRPRESAGLDAKSVVQSAGVDVESIVQGADAGLPPLSRRDDRPAAE